MNINAFLSVDQIKHLSMFGYHLVRKYPANNTAWYHHNDFGDCWLVKVEGRQVYTIQMSLDDAQQIGAQGINTFKPASNNE